MTIARLDILLMSVLVIIGLWLDFKERINPTVDIESKSTHGKFIDERDGERYRTIKIGSQVWMAENLRYDVPNGVGISDTVNFNNPSKKYGRLYSWFTVMRLPDNRDSLQSFITHGLPFHQGICPNAWHVPSDDEWKQLEINLGISPELVDSVNWRSPILSSRLNPETKRQTKEIRNKISRFNILPAGGYFDDFDMMGEAAFFWSSTISLNRNDGAIWRVISDWSLGVMRNYDIPNYNVSCRCVKNAHNI